MVLFRLLFFEVVPNSCNVILTRRLSFYLFGECNDKGVYQIKSSRGFHS